MPLTPLTLKSFFFLFLQLLFFSLFAAFGIFFSLFLFFFPLSAAFVLLSVCSFWFLFLSLPFFFLFFIFFYLSFFPQLLLFSLFAAFGFFFFPLFHVVDVNKESNEFCSRFLAGFSNGFCSFLNFEIWILNFFFFQRFLIFVLLF